MEEQIIVSREGDGVANEKQCDQSKSHLREVQIDIPNGGKQKHSEKRCAHSAEIEVVGERHPNKVPLAVAASCWMRQPNAVTCRPSKMPAPCQSSE
jgi:hypothetical protein